VQDNWPTSGGAKNKKNLIVEQNDAIRLHVARLRVAALARNDAMKHETKYSFFYIS
jgi:hypothetical protein